MGKALGLTPVGIHRPPQNLDGFRNEKRIVEEHRTTSSQVKTASFYKYGAQGHSERGQAQNLTLPKSIFSLACLTPGHKHSRVWQDLREGTRGNTDRPLVVMKRTVLGKKEDFRPQPGSQEGDPCCTSSPQFLGHSHILHLGVWGPAKNSAPKHSLKRGEPQPPHPVRFLESCLLPAGASSTCIHLHQGNSSHHMSFHRGG